MHLRGTLVAAITMSVALTARSAPLLSDEVRQLHGWSMGVDRRANLWSWDGAKVMRLNTAGELVTVPLAAAPIALDADETLGILALTDGGHRVQVFNWDGKFQDAIDLPAESASVCWRDRNQIVVAPIVGTSRAEVWDLRTHAVVQRLGHTTAEPATPGARPAHATLLRYAPGRGELFVLDSFLGQLSVFDAKGKMLREARVANPDEPQLRSWLAEQDRTARAEGKLFTPMLWSFPSMSVSEDGSAWLVEHVEDSVATVARVTPAGSVQHVKVAAPCAGRRLAVWNGQFVFHGSQRSPQPACVGVRRK